MTLELYDTRWGRMLLRANDNVSAALLRGEFWDKHLRPYFDALEPGDVAVDVGAYVGFYTLYLARRGVRVHALEPQTLVYYQLCGTLALNGIETVAAYNLAAFDWKTTLTVGAYQQPGVSVDYEHAPNAAGLAFVPADDGQIQAVRLDELITGHVDLLKVDAQGCDLAALWGAAGIIDNSRPRILFEFEPDLAAVHGETWADYEAFLSGHGYRIEKIGRADYVAAPTQ